MAIRRTTPIALRNKSSIKSDSKPVIEKQEKQIEIPTNAVAADRASVTSAWQGCKHIEIMRSRLRAQFGVIIVTDDIDEVRRVLVDKIVRKHKKSVR